MLEFSVNLSKNYDYRINAGRFIFRSEEQD